MGASTRSSAMLRGETAVSASSCSPFWTIAFSSSWCASLPARVIVTRPFFGLSRKS